MQNYQNLIIQEEREHTHIRIRKKYDPSLMLFFLFTLIFIASMLFWLMPITRENNPDSETNTLAIIELIVGGVGSIILLGLIFQVLKREHILINNTHLILETRLFGGRVFAQSYFLDTITNLSPTEPPIRGWQRQEGYENVGHKEFATYTKDTRKIYHTIRFNYDNREINFAEGLMPHEVEDIIKRINKQKKPNK